MFVSVKRRTRWTEWHLPACSISNCLTSSSSNVRWSLRVRPPFDVVVVARISSTPFTQATLCLFVSSSPPSSSSWPSSVGDRSRSEDFPSAAPCLRRKARDSSATWPAPADGCSLATKPGRSLRTLLNGPSGAVLAETLVSSVAVFDRLCLLAGGGGRGLAFCAGWPAPASPALIAGLR